MNEYCNIQRWQYHANTMLCCCFITTQVSGNILVLKEEVTTGENELKLLASHQTWVI